MILADLYYHGKKINLPKKSYLIIGGMCGIFITGVTGIMGGYLKSFNDIPSVIWYGGLSLLLYSLNIKLINNFFVKLSRISYEWYLVHILVFEIVISNRTNNYIRAIITLFISILISKIYSVILEKVSVKNQSTIINNI